MSKDSIPAPQCCERLEALLTRFQGQRQIYPSVLNAEYRLPTAASPELVDFWAHQSKQVFEPDFIATLPSGRIYGEGNVISPDGASIARDVSNDFGKSFREHWLINFSKIKAPQIIAGRTAVISTTLGSGYGHWLLEELPRLLMLDCSGIDTILAHQITPFSLAALKLCGFKGDAIHTKRHENWVSDELIIPSLIGQVEAPRAEVIEKLNHFVKPLERKGHLGQEKIYISRERARRRNVRNEAELWQVLESRGFTKVYLEDLSWSEQIQVFRSAKMIVAAHGAGLANLAFSRAGTRVIELFHRNYVNGCYWKLASLKGLDYRPLVSDGLQPLAQELQANRLAIPVELTQVIRELDQL
ncbi:MAG: glycosyltransferase 61 family protein [Blastochloris sp.]|nr:glycosyltransferase 61 family protein [Blastochloris sp.]